MAVCWILIFIAAAIVLAFNRAALSVWTVAFAFLLIVFNVFAAATVTTYVVVWIVFAFCAVTLNVLPLRRWLYSRQMMALYRRSMPQMSETEQQALSAGNVGWEGEIFTGMPDWQKLRDLPKGTLSQEEQAFLAGPVEKLCSMVNIWDINQRHFNVSQAIWDYIKTERFFGLIIPKQYGGHEFSALAHAQIITKVASVSTAMATIVSVPNSIGPAELLLHYGTEEQKNYYLPRLARGEEIPCFALTSPVAGSDASSIVDYGVVCHHEFDGKKQLAIRLNWSKRYITLSPVATLIGLAFKLYDPDHLLGDQEELGITCALIPAHLPGVVTGRRHFPLCCGFPNGPTQGKDVMVPLDAVIGGRDNVGKGWRMLMESLAAGRSISLPSMAVGGAKRLAWATGAYARIRHQFKTYIGSFGGVQEALARVGGYTFLIEALRLFTVTAVDRGLKPAVSSAISKYHTTQYARTITEDVMDIHGGKGICMGPNNYAAQSYIESPISITVEGANILTRSLIIFGQGAIRCHPYVLTEMTAASRHDLVAFDRALFAHLGSLFSNKVRAFFLALSRGYLTQVPRGPLRRYYQQFSQYAAAFAWVADVTMITMGARLKRHERLSARLGDLLSLLYIGSAVIKYYELEDEPEMLPFAQWICDDLLYTMQRRLHEFLANLPNRWVAIGMRLVTLSLGGRLKPPSDNLSRQVAKLLLYPSKVRERLANHTFLADVPNNPVGKLEQTLQLVIAAEPLQKKLRKAVRDKVIKGNRYEDKIKAACAANVLTEAEGQQLLQAFAASMKIINVDDFSPEELQEFFAKQDA